MARKQSRGRSRKKPKEVKKKPFDPVLHILPDPIPQRDYAPCPVSGDPISDILTAITDPRSGKPANFDSVITRLAEQENLREGERLAYLGRGAFGVITMEKVDGKMRLVVKKKIQYEEGRETSDWRKELAPGISRDYRPHPEPIHELYTQEEISAFPRFDSTGYNIRNT